MRIGLQGRAAATSSDRRAKRSGCLSRCTISPISLPTGSTDFPIPATGGSALVQAHCHHHAVIGFEAGACSSSTPRHRGRAAAARLLRDGRRVRHGQGDVRRRPARSASACSCRAFAQLGPRHDRSSPTGLAAASRSRSMAAAERPTSPSCFASGCGRLMRQALQRADGRSPCMCFEADVPARRKDRTDVRFGGRRLPLGAVVACRRPAGASSSCSSRSRLFYPLADHQQEFRGPLQALPPAPRLQVAPGERPRALRSRKGAGTADASRSMRPCTRRRSRAGDRRGEALQIVYPVALVASHGATPGSIKARSAASPFASIPVRNCRWTRP